MNLVQEHCKESTSELRDVNEECTAILTILENYDYLEMEIWSKGIEKRAMQLQKVSAYSCRHINK